MNDDYWYLRNRSREAIASMARTIRELQKINGFKDSEVFNIFYSIYRESEGGQTAAIYIFNMIRSLRKIEKARKREK